MFGGERKCEHHAERNRLAVQQSIGEPGGSLECVTERVAEIEQRPLAGLALIPTYGRGLHAAAHRDRMLTRRTAGEYLLPIRLEPGEETGIPHQPVFSDFGIAGAEFTQRQGIE